MKRYSFEYDSSYYPSAPVASIVVRPNRRTGKQQSAELVALIDSGADNTMLPIELLRSINAPRLERAQIRTVSGVAHSVELYGVTIQIGEILISGLRVVGMREPAEPLLGRDVLNALIVTLNGLAGITEVSD